MWLSPFVNFRHYKRIATAERLIARSAFRPALTGKETLAYHSGK